MVWPMHTTTDLADHNKKFPFEHPITVKHLSALSELGYIQVPPISKPVASK